MSKEFWPRDVWLSPPSLIPHPSLLRRLACRLTGGHLWVVHYWTGQGESNWPQHEYCERCWKFRERSRAVPSYETKFALRERVQLKSGRWDNVALVVGHIRILKDGIAYGLESEDGGSPYPLVNEDEIEPAARAHTEE